jgi:uncharacterized protein (TIGR02996 family)
MFPTLAGFRLHPALSGRILPGATSGNGEAPMTSIYEAALLQALAAAPEDELAWQALADVREEQGDPRGPLLRLHLRVRQHWQDPRRDAWRLEMA